MRFLTDAIQCWIEETLIAGFYRVIDDFELVKWLKEQIGVSGKEE